jgi:hypothetical protein
MEQAAEAVFLWSIRHHNQSVTRRKPVAEVNPAAIGTASALSKTASALGTAAVPRRD